MPEFEDDLQWGNGAHSAQHKAAVSEATTTHGGRAMERAMYGRIRFRESHISMINRAMLDLQVDEAGAIEFLRGAAYALIMRFLAATEDGDELPSPSLMARLRLATNLFETFDKAFKALQAADEHILTLAEIMQTND